ncbi:hypothetical protein VTH06DRAFT_1383 [Thermothelomyces fergusii]
MSDLN